MIIRLILLALLLPAGASAGQGMGPGPGFKTYAAAPSWSCTDADVFCENFIGTTDCGDDAANAQNCSYSYTNIENTGLVVDFAQTPSSSPGGQAGSTVLELADSSSSLNGAVAKLALPSPQTTNYTQFYFRLTQGPNLDNRSVIIFRVGESTTFGNTVYTVYFADTTSDNYKILLQHIDNTNTARTSTSSLTNLQIGTWYGVRVYINKNQSSNGISWAIDYDLDGTFTDQTVSTSTGTANRTYAAIGFYNETTTQTDTPKVEFSMIKIDKDGYPGATVP